MLTLDQYFTLLPALVAGKSRVTVLLEHEPADSWRRRFLEQDLASFDAALRTLQTLRIGAAAEANAA